VNLLLDTHVLLWWLDDAATLSASARDAIAEGRNVVFVSAAVVWEIRIQEALGKLEIPKDFREVLDREPFLPLSVTAQHAHALKDLPAHHRDPFDRMLLAQATVERLTVVTRDPRFRPYGVPLLEA
jgi:PIN domain nuclease of toxin-antitoxin system